MKNNQELCNKKMSFQECELSILRNAVDLAEHRTGSKIIQSPTIQTIISIVENFIRSKKLIPYGGTAINAILPKEVQFYNTDVELPDYDFYSSNALQDTKDLCDIYAKAGFAEVEGKPGVHHGTYKVFVNFIPVADITFLHKEIFNELKKEAIVIDGIYYAPPNFLRMSMFLELSRPSGDTSRWEKVLKRLILLNKNYPLHGKNCNMLDFQRGMENKDTEDLVYDTVKNAFIDQGVVFFGGYAMSFYSHYMPKNLHSKFKRYADFDVLSEDSEATVRILKQRLNDVSIQNVKVVKHTEIGEIVATHYQIMLGKDTVAFVYNPIACHSYNTIKEKGKTIKIATIDTMMSFYLAFLYSNREYYDTNRILCMAQYLYEVQQHNRLKQKGLLRRFSINCYGHQQTLEEMRAEKAEKFKELKSDRENPLYEEYFLRYRPGDEVEGKTGKNMKKTRTSTSNNGRLHKVTQKRVHARLHKKHVRFAKVVTSKKARRTRGRGGLFV